MARKAANDIDFETALAQLETIVSRLESGELPLEEALKEFENGIQLAQQAWLRPLKPSPARKSFMPALLFHR